MDNDFIRFKWEKDGEYKYRHAIHEISSRLHQILTEYANTAKKIPDYKDILKRLESINTIIFNLAVPGIYTKSDSFLREAMEYFIKATKLMIDETKNGFDNADVSKVTKVAKLIECGTAFITITSTKNFELFEEMQKEWENENE